MSRRRSEFRTNDDFSGGSTDFAGGPSVVPVQGTRLLFQHALEHRGAPVVHGTKYVLRTDVMYRR